MALDDVRAEDLQIRLAALQTRGLVVGPMKEGGLSLRKPLVPDRGHPASEMVIEDRR